MENENLEQTQKTDDLEREIQLFYPHFRDWEKKESSIDKYYNLNDHDFVKEHYEHLQMSTRFYVDPSSPHSLVAVARNDDRNMVISYVHKTEYVTDPPFFHRLLGPAQYTVQDGLHMSDLRWFLFDQEFSEYEYWKRICETFADRIKLCLASDETRLYLDHQFSLPFPDRINLPVTDMYCCEDAVRYRLDGHPVWKLLGEEYIRTEKFWAYWESKGFDLKTLY